MGSACDAHRGCGLAEYVGSILAHSRLSKSVFVYALMYSNTFASHRADIALSCRQPGYRSLTEREHATLKISSCAHCMFLGSLMIAFKFTHDNCYKIKYWAEWANMEKADIITLELTTLQALGYELVISNDEFEQWAQVYSERCSQPNHTSLFAAVVLYLLVVRRMHSVDSLHASRVATPRRLDRANSRLSFSSESVGASGPSSPDSAIGNCETPVQNTSPLVFYGAITTAQHPSFCGINSIRYPAHAQHPVYMNTALSAAYVGPSGLQRQGHRFAPYGRPADIPVAVAANAHSHH